MDLCLRGGGVGVGRITNWSTQQKKTTTPTLQPASQQKNKNKKSVSDISGKNWPLLNTRIKLLPSNIGGKSAWPTGHCQYLSPQTLPLCVSNYAYFIKIKYHWKKPADWNRLCTLSECQPLPEYLVHYNLHTGIDYSLSLSVISLSEVIWPGKR